MLSSSTATHGLLLALIGSESSCCFQLEMPSFDNHEAPPRQRLQQKPLQQDSSAANTPAAAVKQSPETKSHDNTLKLTVTPC